MRHIRKYVTVFVANAVFRVPGVWVQSLAAPAVRIAGGVAGTTVLTVTTTGSTSLAGEVDSGIPVGPAGNAMLAGLVLLNWPSRKRKWMCNYGPLRVVGGRK